MDTEKQVKEIKQKLKQGQSLDSILDELSKQGVSENDIQTIMETVMTQKPKNKSPLKIIIPIIIIIIILAAAITLAYYALKQPTFELDLPDPEQQAITEQAFTKTIQGTDYKITPVATYNGTFMVASIKEYNDDAKFAPLDFVLLWGNLASSEYDKHLKIEQRDRFWYSTFQENGPYECDYIAFHGANTHMVPANQEIATQLESIKPKQILYLEGKLVNVEANINNTIKTWTTSLTRGDGGEGSCEIFYVEKIENNAITN